MPEIKRSVCSGILAPEVQAVKSGACCLPAKLVAHAGRFSAARAHQMSKDEVARVVIDDEQSHWQAENQSMEFNLGHDATLFREPKVDMTSDISCGPGVPLTAVPSTTHFAVRCFETSIIPCS